MSTKRKQIDLNDLDSYIECEFCGDKVKKLTSHHVEKHGFSMKEYKEAYPSAKLTCKTTKKVMSEAISRRMDDLIYYNSKLDDLEKGRQTTFNNPSINTARIAKSSATRKGRKNRPDLNCKGWANLWNSFSEDERSEFVIDRFKWQSELGLLNIRGIRGTYIDRLQRHIKLKSLHELSTAIFLDLQKLQWVYEGWSIKYLDDVGIVRNYWPDFCIHDPFMYLEVKPFPSTADLHKLALIQISNLDLPLVVVPHQDNLDFCTLGATKNLQQDYVFDFSVETLLKVA